MSKGNCSLRSYNTTVASRWFAKALYLDLQLSLSHILKTLLILLVTHPFMKNSEGLQIRPTNGVRDYCQFESFDANCDADEVILMKSARYGRMRVGRCVARDYGYITCAADVLEEMDKRCSGSKKCHFNIPTLRDTYQPCPKDLTAYLEASYSCVKVANYKNNTCHHHRPVTSNITTGYISTIPLDDSGGGHGSSRCPLVIEGQPGQRINITTFSFSPLHRKSGQHGSGRPYCLFYAIIRDGKSKQNISLCSSTDRRITPFYLSQTHTVTFHFEKIQKSISTEATQALLQYQIVGCPHPKVPKSAWVERKGDKAVVRCNHTTETWYLTCRGNSWVGSVSNCTKVSPWSLGDTPNPDEALPLGLLIAIAIGVIVGVLVGLVLLIFVFVYRRKSRRNKLRDKAKTLLDDECNENEENYARRLMHVEGNNVPAVSGKHQGCGDYTQMWELRHAHRVHGMDPVIESPYGTAHNPTGTIHLPPGTCCNSGGKGGGGGTSFTTFKPREPIYVSSRRPINVTSILRPNLDGVPFYLDVDSRPVGGEHQRSNEQDASNQSPSKRPDLLSSNRSGSGDNSTSHRRNTIPEESAYSSGNRDMCGHCALHQSADDILGEDNIPPPPPTEQNI